ncbi:MAG TPA: M36 family metallopeptidase [Anaeromyxobacteraceae bacterium]|nr:M36 family metallopeptidase [Anaeromyxobacteraceae bacterium]
MRSHLAVTAAVLFLACSASPPDVPVTFDAERARIDVPASGGALTSASGESPLATVSRFLEDRGAPEATAASLRVVSRHTSPLTGATHVRFEQELAGLRVHGAHARAAFDRQGQLARLVDNLAPVGAGRLVPARVTEAEALRAALAALHPGMGQLPAAGGRQGNVTSFAKTGFFHQAPTVERVAILMTSGALKEGFLVQTWSQQGNLLHHTTVSGEGRVLATELRTANDSYRVFPRDPATTPQVVVAGPGAGNAESPAGWLFAGPQRSIDISGNNVHAYLDAIPDNAPDSGGTSVADGNFLATADLGASPTTPANRDVAVQNLFYLNNVVHDTLYRHGFTETAGNFQQDNFGLDTHQGDPVRAEAGDGGGIDNANFATPPDGLPPRMQMYLWTGKGNHQVVVDAPAAIAGTYRAQGAAFGPALDATGISGAIVLADDGTGATSDACEAIQNDLSGKIALVDRGTCTFVIKVKNAQVAGALAVIVANNRGDSIITMGGADATIVIPSVFIGRTDGTTIKSGLPAGVHGTVRRTDPPPLMRDGDLDSDVVWHEYGHGLTWRMIGSMQGPLSGAVGEGMSDVLAIVANENDVVGEYAFDDPLGIRRFPYTNYPLTYGSVQGTEVHNDGEVYAAIGWRLFQTYQAAGISKDVLLDELVDGMNYTPQSPRFEDMRDGILASVAAAGSGHECLVWRAFARYGVGVDAHAKTANGVGLSGPAFPPVPKVQVTESFAVPAQCAP